MQCYAVLTNYQERQINRIHGSSIFQFSPGTRMPSSQNIIKPLNLGDPAIRAYSDALLDRAFGIGRRTKTSYRFREGEQPVEGLSLAIFGTEDDTVPAAIISYWHLCIGKEGHKAIMLGPLAVEPNLQGKGYGRELMRHSLARATEMGHRLVILVGDEPYYGPFGFSRVPEKRLLLPGPVDPARLLYCELEAGSFDAVSGLVLPPSRYREAR